MALQHFKEGYKSDPDHAELKKAYQSLKAYQKLASKASETAGAGNMAILLETVNDALSKLHGPDLVSQPEYDTGDCRPRSSLTVAVAVLVYLAFHCACLKNLAAAVQ